MRVQIEMMKSNEKRRQEERCKSERNKDMMFDVCKEGEEERNKVKRASKWTECNLKTSIEIVSILPYTYVNSKYIMQYNSIELQAFRSEQFGQSGKVT